VVKNWVSCPAPTSVERGSGPDAIESLHYTESKRSNSTAEPYAVVHSYDVAVSLMDIIREFEAEHEAEKVGGRVQPVAAAGGRRRVRQCETLTGWPSG
jgi:hypothetical protein